MNSSIKVIKRKRDEDLFDMKTVEREKSVEQITREMVGTIKSWIAELQEAKSPVVSSTSVGEQAA